MSHLKYQWFSDVLRERISSNGQTWGFPHPAIQLVVGALLGPEECCNFPVPFNSICSLEARVKRSTFERFFIRFRVSKIESLASSSDPWFWGLSWTHPLWSWTRWSRSGRSSDQVNAIHFIWTAQRNIRTWSAHKSRWTSLSTYSKKRKGIDFGAPKWFEAHDSWNSPEGWYFLEGFARSQKLRKLQKSDWPYWRVWRSLVHSI